MKRPARILVVDDSVVARQLVCDSLGDDPAFEIVGTAHNGQSALHRVGHLRPDIVIMDIEMPVLDGLKTLSILRARDPLKPQVIILSRRSEREARIALEALSRGATDFVQKPIVETTADEAREQLARELKPVVSALALRLVQRSSPSLQRPSAYTTAPPSTADAVDTAKKVEVVALGASTGGPEALAAILPELPGALPVPIVIVQHMPPVFTRMLAERLERRCPFPVHEARDAMPIQPGHAYIAPGGHHLRVVRVSTHRGEQLVARLDDGPPVHSCRPAVDVLFESVAKVAGVGALGVILTGMGRDGCEGSRAIKAAGGAVISQDEASSVVWGMPGWVVREKLADRILPLTAIGRELGFRLLIGRRPVKTGRRSSSRSKR